MVDIWVMALEVVIKNPPAISLAGGFWIKGDSYLLLSSFFVPGYCLLNQKSGATTYQGAHHGHNNGGKKVVETSLGQSSNGSTTQDAEQ